jgi:hypothetical protein
MPPSSGFKSQYVYGCAEPGKQEWAETLLHRAGESAWAELPLEKSLVHPKAEATRRWTAMLNCTCGQPSSTLPADRPIERRPVVHTCGIAAMWHRLPIRVGGAPLRERSITTEELPRPSATRPEEAHPDASPGKHAHTTLRRAATPPHPSSLAPPTKTKSAVVEKERPRCAGTHTGWKQHTLPSKSTQAGNAEPLPITYSENDKRYRGSCGCALPYVCVLSKILERAVHQPAGSA